MSRKGIIAVGVAAAVAIICGFMLQSPEVVFPGDTSFYKEWDVANNTLTIKSLNGTAYLTIQQISHTPDLCSCEETFNITSYVNYEIDNLKDFRVRWQKHQGKHNITSSEWHIQKNQSYNVFINDYGDILKSRTIPNIMTHENITDAWECSETKCNLGNCSSSQKWNITRGTINGTETGIVCFNNYEVVTASPLKIRVYWNETGIIATHDETRHRLTWNKFRPIGKTLQKNKSYVVKLVFKKKPELGTINIRTIPMFGGIEEQNLTWWNTSWTKKRELKMNNTGGSALTYYQIYVNLTDTPINETSLRVVNETGDVVVPHWCESVTSDNCTKLWSNATSLPNAAWLNETYYIYYDSAVASSVSDGNTTFIFFDNFDRANNATVGNGWTETGNSQIKDNCAYANDVDSQIERAFSFSSGMFRLAMRTKMAAANRAFTCELRDGSYRARLGMNVYSNLPYQDDIMSTHPEVTILDGYVVDTFYELENCRIDSSNFNHRVNHGEYSNEGYDPTLTTSENKMHFLLAYDTGSSSYTDWIFVGKYASVDPTTSLGSEEAQALNPPSLSGQTPSTPHSSTYTSSTTFNATSNQSSNNCWLLDSVLQEWDNATTAPTYTNSTAPTGTYNLTLVARADGNDSLTDSMTWSWTVTLAAPPDIVNGVYGFLNTSIPNNATILDYKNDSIVTIEATIDWDAITSGTWSSFKSAVNYSYGINRRTALRMDCGGEYNTTVYDGTVKVNITTHMPDLKTDPYQTDLQYIVINLTNVSASVSNKTSFVNVIAQNISEQTDNKFKTVVLETLTGLDSAWVSESPIIYIELDSVTGWIDDETETLRGNTTLSRMYSGNESFLSDVYDHKTNILNKMRSTSNVSNQYTETYSVKVDNDIILYNNGSSTTNRTVASALAGYYWALENDTMQDISSAAATIGFWISGKSYDYIIKESSLDRIMYVSDVSSKLWGGTTTTEEEQVYNDGAYDDAYAWAGTNTDLRAEFWDPTYTKENTHMIHYEWINASAIKDYSIYDYIIIADQNANEINNTIGQLNDTYGYVSVSDYADSDSWQTNKTAECDVWIDNYHTNVFIDGIDFAVLGGNASSRLKDITDHIRNDKDKKVIMNTYTFYEDYATYGDAVMKESAFSRWSGAVGNPTYSWEDMAIEKDRADFYASHNIPVLAMSFGNLTNYDKMAFDYAAFAVLYGLSDNNSFRYGQPNFQSQKDIRVIPLGTMLEPSYTETSATDWNRLYQNGRMHINPADHAWSLDDNKVVNNISVKFYLYSGAEGSGDRNVYVFANTNDTIHTIPYNAGVDPVSSWVFRTAHLNTSEYKDHGHYYIYAYTRPGAGGWNFMGKATADPVGDPKTWYDTTSNNLPTTTDDQTWNTVLPTNFMCNLTVNCTTSKYLDDLVSRIAQAQTQVLGYDYTNSTATYDFTISVWHGDVLVSTTSDATTHVKNVSGNWQELNVSLVADAGSPDITWNYTTVDGGQYGAARELISADNYKYRYLSPHMSLQEFRSGTLLTTPSISNVVNGSISSTSQYIDWDLNQTAHNRVVYDKGSVATNSVVCEGQWSTTHACTNASDGNWSTYAESAGALLAYAYFNYSIPTGTSQLESLYHVKDAIGHANLTIPSACWGSTLYLRAMGSDIGNSITWQCDNGPGWTTLRSSVANVAYEQEMKFKYVSSWDNSTAAPNITLSSLTANTKHYFQAQSYNAVNDTLSTNSSTFDFTTAAATNPITITNGNRALLCNWTIGTTFTNIATNLTNCTDFFYYNSTSQIWTFYNVNRTINANTAILEHAAIFVCFNATTTVDCEVLPAETITIPANVYYYTSLRESAPKTLTEINTAITTDGCTITDLYAWNSTAAAYANTGSYSVLPNEGFAIYATTGCSWDGGV